MVLSEDELRDLLDNPRENLGVELKRWIDPNTDEGAAKIAKGCIALRNNNGGLLIIGFNDDGKPDEGNAPADVPATFHVDCIQRIVGQYASEPFSVEVQFGERDGTLYPVISVPPGVRTPVAAKRDLCPPGKLLVRDHAVYVRSLSSNYTVSTGEARRGDWERLVQICFDNREADIGAFVRRHLAAIDLDRLGPLLSGLSGPPRPSATDRAKKVLDSGRDRFLTALKERGVDMPAVGFREAAVVIDGEVPEHATTESFLQRLFVAQPQHSGWPAWVDSRLFPDAADRPVVCDGAWEALLSGEYGPSQVPYLDFWRIDPRGIFYRLTALEDDLPGPAPRPEPRKQLDFLLQIARVAEIIAVALSFGRSMGCEPLKTSLAFAFRWSGLKGRYLTSWVQPLRAFHKRAPASQDEVVTAVTVPLDTPRSAIAPHVEAVVRHLFALFRGTEFDSRVIRGIVEESLQIRF